MSCRPRCESVLRLTAVCLCIFSASSRADEPTTLAPVARPTVLFDGTGLSEWIFYTRDSAVTKSDVCRVEDGILRIAGQPNGYLQTRRWYRDYVLDVEWRWPGAGPTAGPEQRGGNSGVLVHTTTPLLFYGWPRSLEVQLAHGHAGDFWVIGDGVDLRVDDEAKRRAAPRAGDAHSHRRIRRSVDEVEKPIGEWNRMSVICRGDEVIVEVNGRVVNHGKRCTVDRGAIALQSEGTPIEFRHVAIRPVPRVPTPPVSAPPAASPPEPKSDPSTEPNTGGTGRTTTPRLTCSWDSKSSERPSQTVRIDGKPFATIRHSGHRVPCVWPLYGPGGVPVTRGYPIEAGPDDATDHPHHQSFWFAHGNVDGHDFWHGAENAIEFESAKSSENANGTVSVDARYRWTAAGTAVLHEHRTLRFGATEYTRWIDAEIRLRSATDRSIRFGDTKEGTFALRLHPELRVEGAVAKALLTNSELQRNKAAWGQRARWIESRGSIGGQPMIVALFDHPLNLRHPTWWHARTYGLVAANPFGVHDFEEKPAGTGDFVLAADDTLVLRYRVQLVTGITDCEAIDNMCRAWGSPTSIHWDSPESLDRLIRTSEGEWRITPTSGTQPATLELTMGGSDYQPPQRSPRRIALFGEHTYGSFSAELDAMQTGREYGHRDLCFFFGFQDAAHFYYVHLASNPDEHACNVFLVTGADRRRIAEIPPRGVDWGENAWHRIRVERDLGAGWIRVFFDNLETPILVARDNTLGAGQIGVGSFDDTGRFRRVRVWAHDGESKGEAGKIQTDNPFNAR